MSLEAALEQLHDEETAIVLHDRMVPGSHARIDHVAITRGGVWAIEVPGDTGMVQRIDRGGWFRHDYRLYVGNRHCTDMVVAIESRIETIRSAIGDPADLAPGARARGALCFAHAEWSLVERPIAIRDVWIGRPEWLVEELRAPGGLAPAQLQALAKRVAEALPSVA